jgi:flagellar M-ring protein FliF
MSKSKSSGQVANQLRDFVTSLTARQRMLLGGGAVLVALVLLTFVRLLSKPEMSVLYSNLEAADAQSLEQKLAAKNIRYELSQDGKSVLVPADKLDAARVEIATEGAPHSGRMGFELFDKANWASSDFDDKVNYQRALEGELERTIQAMRGVEAARVHLAIPPDSLYSAQERQAKAAVILKLREHHISATMRRAVQSLVAAAVDKLDSRAVTVVDAESGDAVLSASAESEGEEHGAEEVLAARLVHTLEPIVGADHVRATVHAEFDPSTVEEEEESYDPEKTVALTMQRTEESNGAGQTGGAAGTASNVPGGGTPATHMGETASLAKSENGTYAVNKVVRRSSQPAGRLKRLAIAVLVDDAYDPANKAHSRQRRSAGELKGIEELAKASVGFDSSRGDILSVQNISFQSLPMETPAAPTRLEEVRTTMREWSSYVRIAVLVLLFAVTYLAVLRPVKRQMVRALHAAPAQAALNATAKIPLAAGGEENLLPEAPGKMAQLRSDVSTRIKSEPAAASRLVESWVLGGERK